MNFAGSLIETIGKYDFLETVNTFKMKLYVHVACRKAPLDATQTAKIVTIEIVMLRTETML